MEVYIILVASFLSFALCEHMTSKCHGNNYMNSMCNNNTGVIVIQKLQFGAKLNINDNCTAQTEKLQSNACCTYEEDDCLEDVTDYANKYLYFSRLSGLTGISQNTATPWTRMACGGGRTFSNYVRVVFDCIKESEIKNFCSYQKMTSSNGSVYLHRKRFSNISNTCECMIESQESSTINVHAVDVRLQPNYPIDQNHTGDCTNATNILTISGKNNVSNFECKDDTIYGGFAKLYSSLGNSINISYSEEGEEPQSVWIFVNVSKGEFQIECNPQLTTTTSTTSSTLTTVKSKNSQSNMTSSGNHGNSYKNKTTHSPGTKTKPSGSKNSDSGVIETGPSARAKERAMQNTVIYCVIGLAAIAAILIIAAGFFIHRARRSAEHQRKYKKVQERNRQSDPSIFNLEKLPRETSTHSYAGPTDQLY